MDNPSYETNSKNKPCGVEIWDSEEVGMTSLFTGMDIKEISHTAALEPSDNVQMKKDLYRGEEAGDVRNDCSDEEKGKKFAPGKHKCSPPLSGAGDNTQPSESAFPFLLPLTSNSTTSTQSRSVFSPTISTTPSTTATASGISSTFASLSNASPQDVNKPSIFVAPVEPRQSLLTAQQSSQQMLQHKTSVPIANGSNECLQSGSNSGNPQCDSSVSSSLFFSAFSFLANYIPQNPSSDSQPKDNIASGLASCEDSITTNYQTASLNRMNQSMSLTKEQKSREFEQSVEAFTEERRRILERFLGHLFRRREAFEAVKLLRVNAKELESEANDLVASEKFDEADSTQLFLLDKQKEVSSNMEKQSKLIEYQIESANELVENWRKLCDLHSNRISHLNVCRRKDRHLRLEMVNEEVTRIREDEKRLHDEIQRIEITQFAVEQERKIIEEETQQINSTIDCQTDTYRCLRAETLEQILVVQRDIDDLEVQLADKKRHEEQLHSVVMSCDIKISAIRSKFQKQTKRIELAEARFAEAQQDSITDFVMLDNLRGQLSSRTKTAASRFVEMGENFTQSKITTKQLSAHRTLYLRYLHTSQSLQTSILKSFQVFQRRKTSLMEARSNVGRLIAAQEKTRAEVAVSSADKNSVESKIPNVEAAKRLAVESRNYKLAGTCSRELKSLQEKVVRLKEDVQNGMDELNKYSSKVEAAKREESRTEAKVEMAKNNVDKVIKKSLCTHIRAINEIQKCCDNLDSVKSIFDGELQAFVEGKRLVESCEVGEHEAGSDSCDSCESEDGKVIEGDGDDDNALGEAADATCDDISESNCEEDGIDLTVFDVNLNPKPAACEEEVNREEIDNSGVENAKGRGTLFAGNVEGNSDGNENNEDNSDHNDSHSCRENDNCDGGYDDVGKGDGNVGNYCSNDECDSDIRMLGSDGFEEGDDGAGSGTKVNKSLVCVGVRGKDECRLGDEMNEEEPNEEYKSFGGGNSDGNKDVDGVDGKEKDAKSERMKPLGAGREAEHCI